MSEIQWGLKKIKYTINTYQLHQRVYLEYMPFYWCARTKTGKFRGHVFTYLVYRVCLFLTCYYLILELFRQCGIFFLHFIIVYVEWIIMNLELDSVRDIRLLNGCQRALRIIDCYSCVISFKYCKIFISVA